MRITAAGSLPGTDFRGALTAMTEALPEMLPLPELPERGPDSRLVGRALGLIDGLGFDVQPAGWRLTHHSSADHRRARARWRQDLDDAEELLQDFDGVLKVGVGGPWTLAACVERPAGDWLLADHGARRELAQALADGVERLRAELARRLPRCEALIQVDEPSLVAVADGAIPTASGFSKHRRVDLPELTGALALLAPGVLHCCAPGAWLGWARSAGYDAVSVDAALADYDELARWLDEGREVVLGVVDTAAARVQSTDELVTRTLRVLRTLAIDDAARHVVLGTACGLAGWSPREVSAQLRALAAAAPLVEEALHRG
ncbi:MAG TPA: uroporphyrinogen decarboxylase family protein [Arachnia sp.]|nr:uroporphyrinogen decarboxylase family protein [Arachnia sp.]HMT85900.1 uroporphyrinogen decarboxylase family protein [Arachnia sp.]